MAGYIVYRYGERMTSRHFMSLPDAIDYYDRQCKNAKGVSVRLVRDNDLAILYHNTDPDAPIQISNGQYRDISTKRKKKDTGMHPFGL